MRQPVLIFDFGNVLAFFDYSQACVELGRRLGLSGVQFVARLRERGFDDLNRRFEAGQIEPVQFSSATCELAGLDLPHDEFATYWADIFELNEPVARLAADLKRRDYTLVLGSNTNAIHAPFYRRRFADALAPFDRFVLSYEVGTLKPSAEFYHACAEAAGAEPRHCLFIDDLVENVEGARAAGLEAIQYQDVPSLLAELARHGVELAEPEQTP
jgi:putative hydrolase of the HAD superfamily